MKIPQGLDDLTLAWVRDALAPHFGPDLVGLEVAPIGTGQVADSARLSLTWDGAAAAGGTGGERPATLVAKVTSGSEVSKAAAAATRTYEVEVGFYTDLAASLAVRTPRCYWAGYDPTIVAYSVVLEDGRPGAQGDQLAGCSLDDASAALVELVGLHAPRWGDPELSAVPWLARHTPQSPADLAGLLAQFLPEFLTRYAEALSPDVVALTERFVPRAEEYGRNASGARTVVHGDFRNDNLLFGNERVWVLDWQTVALGTALSDVAYFLGGSLLTEIRRVEEEALVRGYWERLTAAGADMTWDDCWRAYRRHAFGGLIMAIVASIFVARTDRGDAMFVAMAERAGRHALDLESESLI